MQVKAVQNITDVGHMSDDFQSEDKLLAQSKKEGRDPYAIARKYEENFHRDLARLNILPANMYPRASQNIELMLELIGQLLLSGHAYIGSDKSIYFAAASYPEYGQLSGNRLNALKPGHRYEYTDEGGKLFHADWALWKAAGSRTEMIWDSPWGAGFPGWHIECSAMSLYFLDQHVDIHVGGIDLRFPHHENERAQSNVIEGRECVDLWVHGEHLLFEGRKMSKSAGNVVLLQDVIDRGFDPLAIRLVFLENRYRSQMDLSWETIAAAHKTLGRWRSLVSEGRETPIIENSEILQALNEDLDTPRAIQIVRRLEKDASLSADEKIAAFLFADLVFGLDLRRAASEQSLSFDVEKLLTQRSRARSEKNWNESDRIRIILESQGLAIHDTSEGQTWEWK